MWLEGLGKLKKYNDLIGNRNHDLPACSIMPQATKLPRIDEPSDYKVPERVTDISLLN
jgi:hypothetical protein